MKISAKQYDDLLKACSRQTDKDALNILKAIAMDNRAAEFKGQSISVERKMYGDATHTSVCEKICDYWCIAPDINFYSAIESRNKRTLIHIPTGLGIVVVGSRAECLEFYKAHMAGKDIDWTTAESMTKSADFKPFLQAAKEFQKRK